MVLPTNLPAKSPFGPTAPSDANKEIFCLSHRLTSEARPDPLHLRAERDLPVPPTPVLASGSPPHIISLPKPAEPLLGHVPGCNVKKTPPSLRVARCCGGTATEMPVVTPADTLHMAPSVGGGTVRWALTLCAN